MWPKILAGGAISVVIAWVLWVSSSIASAQAASVGIDVHILYIKAAVERIEHKVDELREAK